jgi:hypothetical protein
MLSELSGRGWVIAQPPRTSDDSNVVARYDGEPVRAGFQMEADNEGTMAKYRSGQYDVEVKIDFDTGRGMLRVTEADGYD